MTLHIWIS